MNNNYRIIRTIHENVFQRVLECKDDNSGEVFYNNVITSPRLINLINIEGLKSIFTNILECYRTEDRLYIVTKPLEEENTSLKEYIKSNKLTLKQQFYMSKSTIKLCSDIFNMSDIVQQKILDLDKIYIGSNERLVVDCNLIFEQDYDISDNETMKRMGNILHFIFSGSEISDYNISELIPPDILKIIVRSLTKEYMYPQNALTELVNSPLYKMIYPNNEIPAEKHKEEAKKEIKTEAKTEAKKQEEDLKVISKDESQDDTAAAEMSLDRDREPIVPEEKEDDSDGVYNIYLKGSNDEDVKKNKPRKKLKKRTSNKDIKRAVVSIAVVILVLLAGNQIISKLGENSKSVSGNSTDGPQQGKNNEGNNEGINNSENDVPPENSDITNKFFNSEQISQIGYTGAVAEIDKDIYVDGNSSLLVKNQGEDKIKSLFAVIDFTDPNYSYMLKQKIGISTKMKAEKDLSASIVLEAYKDGKVASSFHTKADIYDDIWSNTLISINVTEVDRINVYLEYSGVNKVWIDSVYVDTVNK